MRLVDGASRIKQFRRTDWKFQQSFRTPPKTMAAFGSLVMGSLPDLTEASFAIEEVVFEPKHFLPLLERFGVSPICRPGVAFECSADETAPLLQAVLADWINFIFNPVPKAFTMFGHHDEFVTFFSHNHSSLHRVVDALSGAGFKTVEDFHWKPSEANRRRGTSFQ